MQCYEFVYKNLQPGDRILRQAISTDWASREGHFAILRGDRILEYMPGIGKRDLSVENYWQVIDGEKVRNRDTNFGGFFRIASKEELDEVCRINKLR